MPLVEVTLAEGRSPEQIRALLHELHAAVVRAVGAPGDSVRVVIREVPATHWSAGDVTLAERRAGQGSPGAGRDGAGGGQGSPAVGQGSPAAGQGSSGAGQDGA
jgi:4-oxalocrotonate tautomerase